MAIWKHENHAKFKLSDYEFEVWTNNYQANSILFESLGQRECIFCNTNMKLLDKRISDTDFYQYYLLHVCNSCGWWVVTNHGGYHHGYQGQLVINRVAGVLKKLDTTDVTIPLNELCKYLIAKYKDRFLVNPKIYEDIVANVFKDFGYRIRQTSFSGDKGIDIFILNGDNQDTIGIQVKRTKNKIGAGQIRSFAGSLVLNDVTRGIYVSASEYTSGANDTASEYINKGFDLVLVDAEDFYSKLKLSSRPQYSSSDDHQSPFYRFWSGDEKIPYVHGFSW